MKKTNLLFLYLAVAIASVFPLSSTALGKVAFTPVTSPEIKKPVMDTAAASDGSMIFFLTPGEIHVYDTEKKDVIDRFPVEATYDRLTYAEGAKSLVLTSSHGTAPRIYRVEVVHEIHLDGHPVRGPESAPVTIAVFSDYQCPYCSRVEGFLQQVTARYQGKVRFVMKHFPLASHKFARQASRAALAADRQGKFWAFHEALFAHYKEINEEKIRGIAQDLKLDLKRWEKDRTDPAIDAIIDGDLENGRRIGVRGTPTVFVNGKEARMRSPQEFIAQVEAEMAKAD